MNKRIVLGICVIPLLAAAGCGTHKNVLSQLSSQDQAKVTQALDSGGNMHLPHWLPFTPTHASTSTKVGVGLIPTDRITITLYNDSERLVIVSPYEALAVYNVPNSLRLKNGEPASFKQTSNESILSWANGPTQEYTLYSAKIQNGDPNAITGPDLSSSQLKKIAESIPTE